jgi:EmrB/QacA subfamily drug resistance transporter
MRFGRRRSWVLGAVCLGQFMLMVDITIILVALPDLGSDLGTSFSDVQWIVDAYALTLAAFLLNTGAIADRVGRRRIFVTGLVIFGMASALCGAATSPEMLIASRALQGLGGAMLFATCLAIIGVEFTGRDRAKALGIFGAVFGAAVAVGPLIGGLLIDVAGWRWIFFVNVPIAAGTILVALRSIREHRDPNPRSVDLPGQILFAGGIVLLITPLVKGEEWGWTSVTTLGLLSAAVVALLMFAVVERIQARPMFDLELLRERSFAGASLAAFATSASLFGMFVYLTFYFQAIDGLTPLEAGLRFTPVTVLAFVIAAVAGTVSDRVSPRLVLSGALLCSAGGLASLTVLDGGDSWAVLLPGLALCGIGFGAANPTVAAVTLAVAAPDRAATATGMNSTFRQVGIAAGVAALGAIFHHAIVSSLGATATLTVLSATTSATPDSGGAATRAYVEALHQVFLVSAAVAALGAFATLILVRVRAGETVDGSAATEGVALAEPSA